MDSNTYTITIAFMICIGLFGVIAVAGSIYGILVWYPAYRKRKTDTLKASGRQGEATIIRLPDHQLGNYPGRSSVFTMVPIRLEISVVGIDPYEVDKTFTIPTHALDGLEEGKVVAVWVDPKNPRNLDKIVIDLN
jgi:hypothetical protein